MDLADAELVVVRVVAVMFSMKDKSEDKVFYATEAGFKARASSRMRLTQVSEETAEKVASWPVR